MEEGRDPAVERLAALPAVREVRRDTGGFSLTVGEPHVAIPALLQLLAVEGLALSRLTTRHASLEDVFVRLTGRHLGNEDAAPR